MKHLYQFSYFLIIWFLLFTGCKAKLQHSASTGDYIEIETTGCLGPCPVYKLRVYSETAVYEGLSHVERIGSYSATLRDSVSQEINILFNSSELENAKTSYQSTKNLDLPTTYLRLSKQDSIKEIMIYGTPPSSLTGILDYLMALQDSLDWE